MHHHNPDMRPLEIAGILKTNRKYVSKILRTAAPRTEKFRPGPKLGTVRRKPE
jgi:transcriptional regulator